MALIDRYTLTQDSTFQHRCEQAALEQASVVLQEADTVAHHKARALLATKVVAEPAGFGVVFAQVAATVPAVATAAGVPANQSGVSDALIGTVVAGAWDAVAGARG